MILTGNQIKWAKEKGYLDISPWDDSRINPNSYNLRLADELMVYTSEPYPEYYGFCAELDMKKENNTILLKIPEEGLMIYPGKIYLGRTMEYTETHKFVPMLEGRSSVGRLGISIHATAGFGDIGFCGYWTLEISCVHPVRIYPGVEICQIYYHTTGYGDTGDIFIPIDTDPIKYSNGKYQNNAGIQPSMIWKEFE